MEKIKKKKKKRRVDRQRQMPPFGISAKLQRGASLEQSQEYQTNGGRTTRARSLPLQYAQLSSGNRKSDN